MSAMKKACRDSRDICLKIENGFIPNNCLHLLSLRIAAVIIGASGSGKSTICNLIARFYDVQKGEILVGGHNVKEFCSGKSGKMS